MLRGIISSEFFFFLKCFVAYDWELIDHTNPLLPNKLHCLGDAQRFWALLVLQQGPIPDVLFTLGLLENATTRRLKSSLSMNTCGLKPQIQDLKTNHLDSTPEHHVNANESGDGSQPGSSLRSICEKEVGQKALLLSWTQV